ncbi:hypothetical protein FOG18_11710 [Legionella israelensis]|uniref:hypothetical protein n=1 Tax=Legionella israelensis TaxID=454 RepID=UPI001180E379|nr:hypothetical protein [Legionella israelensis]QDP73179.1 hypothetical protein FOG18_11710 [Legionella israelensis]
MAKNEALLKVLNGRFPGKDPDSINNALDALIKADPTKKEEFRGALVEHKGFWASLLSIQDKEVDDKDEFLLSAGEDPDPTQNDFSALHKKAAHVRVFRKLGQAPVEVLANIVIKNNKEAREEINEAATLWDKDGLGELNETILTDESITAIKAEARKLLMPKLMQKINNENSFENLEKKLDDCIGYHLEGLQESDKQQLEAAMNARAMVLAQAKLANHGNRDQLVALLKENDLAKVQDEAKPIMDDHAKWIKRENIEDLKKSAREGLAKLMSVEIERLPYNEDHLTKLIKAADPKNIATYQRELAAVRIANTDLLKRENYSEVLDAIRNKAFEMQVEKLSPYSPYGKEIHKALIDAFKAATPEKKEIIFSNLEKNIQRLMHATDVNDVKSMLGIPDRSPEKLAKATALTEENKRLEKLKRITSLDVAKILAKIDPPIDLSGIETNIDDFNNKFYEINAGDYTRGSHGNEKAGYLDLVSELLIALTKTTPDNPNPNPHIDPASFYTTFGVNADATDVTDLGILQGFIMEPRAKNLSLAKHAYAPDSKSKEFMHQFMRMDKGNLVALDDTEVKDLWDSFTGSKSYEEFKNKITSNNAIKAKLPTDWPKQFTAADFDKLKLKQLNSERDISKFVDKRLEELKIRENKKFMSEGQRKILEKIGGGTANINDVMRLFNPAFMGKSKAEAEKMRSRLMKLAESYDTIIRRMKQQKEVIEGLQKSLQAPDSNMGKKLQGKIAEIDMILKTYEPAQKQLVDHILPDLQKVIESKKVIRGFGSDFGVISKVFKKGSKEYEDVKKKRFRSDNFSEASVTHGHQKNISTDEMDSDELGILDVTTEKGGSSVVSRIIEEHGSTKPEKVYASDKQKITPRKFSVDLLKTNNPQERELIEKARMKTAMVAVCQLLAELDGPPDKKHPIRINGSDPEDLKYLWTAVKIAQKELEGTKMAFKDDAIQGDSIEYLSKTQKGRLGWKEDSVYKTVFEEKENKLVWKKIVDKLKGDVNEKFGHDKLKGFIYSAVSQHWFKKEVQEGVKGAEEELKKEHKESTLKH